MTSSRYRLALLATTGLIVASTFPRLAVADTFEIDPAHSSVNFAIRHLVSRVQGRFDQVAGTIEMDPGKPAEARVLAEIATKSVNTGVENRDNHLRSADFFDAEKNPKIVFESTGVIAQGADKATLAGNLTLHGVTKPVTIEVTGLGFARGMKGEERAGFEGRTKINRKEFNLTWNKILDAGALLLGDEVEVTLLVEAVKKAPAPPAAPAAGTAAPAPGQK
jgi:polyisoprenoid-binding protein YceI